MNTRTTITLKTRITYALPGFALAVVGIPLFVHIPKFYTDVVGVDIALVGLIVLGGRILDAISDPLIGMWSDATHTRFGRRRPFIGVGSILVALALIALLIPPDVDTGMAAWWFGGSLMAVMLLWTMVTIPYESMAPEITYDYDERTGLLAWRDGILIAGLLFASVLPAIIHYSLGTGEDPADQRRVFTWMAIIVAALMVSLSWWMIISIKEKPLHLTVKNTVPWAAWKSVLNNRPFIILLASYSVAALGSNLPATLILYYVTYVLQIQNAEIFLLLYLATGIAFLPLWVRLARAWSKKSAWLLAMGLNTIAFIGVMFLGPGEVWAYGMLVTLSGTGMGATIALPSAMQADVIDYDAAHSGQRREGLYIGLWSISRKMAAAFGVGVALTILGSVGYQPNVAQTPQVVLTLKILYALVPALFNILGIIIALFYPLNRSSHQALVARLQTAHSPASRAAGPIPAAVYK